MKNLSVTSIVALLLFAVCARAEDKPEVLKSEAGGFEVSVPFPVKESKQESDSAAGKLVFHMFTGEKNDSAFIVSYNDYPADIIKGASSDKLLDGGRDGAIGSYKGKLVSETKITLDGNPGREFEISSNLAGMGDVTIRTRIYMVGPRLCQVVYLAKKGAVTEEEMYKYIRSFKLLKAAGK